MSPTNYGGTIYSKSESLEKFISEASYAARRSAWKGQPKAVVIGQCARRTNASNVEIRFQYELHYKERGVGKVVQFVDRRFIDFNDSIDAKETIIKTLVEIAAGVDYKMSNCGVKGYKMIINWGKFRKHDENTVASIIKALDLSDFC